MMKAIERAFKATRIPLVARMPLLGERYNNMRWLPVNEDLRLQGDAPLPVNILYRFIEEASRRAVCNRCECRHVMDCRDYPAEIGCLFLGDSALDGPPGLFHEVSAEEARGHVNRALQTGLVPMVGKNLIDNFLFGIKERHRLLSICFCCECCCISRYVLHSPSKVVESTFPRLEGVTVEVTDECTGCGTCVEHCYIQAMRVVEDRAVIAESCRACGRCATACPNHAIEVSIDDPEYLDKCYERIRSLIKFD